MPVPASDAIASDVGHGAYGVRYRLRPFRDLLSETVGQRHLWVELRPKKLFATWTSEGSGVYSKAVAETFDGITLPVVGVKTLTETLLAVESQARCTAGAGTFYYSGATLYIHLTGGANPSGTTVVAELGIHLGSHGVYQPLFLPDRLLNGSLDAWTGSAPNSWTTSTDAGVTLDKTTSDPLQGVYAARFTFAAASTGNQGSLYQDITTLVAGVAYRFSGAYRSTAGLQTYLMVSDGSSTYLLYDGRSTGGFGALADDQSGIGEWRRFAFDFLCPSWGTVRFSLRGLVISGPMSGTVDFDDLKLQPMSRYTYHEPLLTVESLPTIEAARADAFWGEMSSALGSMTIANPRWEALLAAYDWIGAQAVVRVGGRYQLRGDEILMDDCPVIALGKLT